MFASHIQSSTSASEDKRSAFEAIAFDKEACPKKSRVMPVRFEGSRGWGSQEWQGAPAWLTNLWGALHCWRASPRNQRALLRSLHVQLYDDMFQIGLPRQSSQHALSGNSTTGPRRIRAFTVFRTHGTHAHHAWVARLDRIVLLRLLMAWRHLEMTD